ncbi:hypothetical protein FACS189419_04710 [Planctomycetales bacterium]|nr:hypothetical protein FACS189419_04710 [Planctomycetales bacterium]
MLSVSILYAEDITLSNSAGVKIQLQKTDDGSVYRPVAANDAKRIEIDTRCFFKNGSFERLRYKLNVPIDTRRLFIVE